MPFGPSLCLRCCSLRSGDKLARPRPLIIARTAIGIDGTNTRIRLGVAHCVELLVDLPDYFRLFTVETRLGFRT